MSWTAVSTLSVKMGVVPAAMSFSLELRVVGGDHGVSGWCCGEGERADVGVRLGRRGTHPIDVRGKSAGGVGVARVVERRRAIAAADRLARCFTACRDIADG